MLDESRCGAGAIDLGGQVAAVDIGARPRGLRSDAEQEGTDLAEGEASSVFSACVP
jgi:hypothetical protein